MKSADRRMFEGDSFYRQFAGEGFLSHKASSVKERAGKAPTPTFHGLMGKSIAGGLLLSRARFLFNFLIQK